jgi:hypothetical protein
VSGALPAGIVGGFGPDLQRFILALHFQGQVTTDRLTALLTGMGVVISKRQVVRLLAKGAQTFAAEDAQVLRAGLATPPWITVDDTSARHARRDGYTTQIGDNRFTTFRTGSSKSRANFLSILRAGSSLFVINAPRSTICVGAVFPKQRSGRSIAPAKRNSPTPRLSTHISTRWAFSIGRRRPAQSFWRPRGRCGARSVIRACWRARW